MDAVAGGKSKGFFKGISLFPSLPSSNSKEDMSMPEEPLMSVSVVCMPFSVLLINKLI
jgi:hypothetical protein